MCIRVALPVPPGRMRGEPSSAPTIGSGRGGMYALRRAPARTATDRRLRALMNAFVVEVEKVTKIYRLRGSRRTKSEHEIRAVDNVSFDVPVGRSLAIVGESGSGKTTIARMIVGLELPTSGMIRIAGHPRPVSRASPKERRLLARDVQIVFQDPYASLDPRQTVAAC